MEAKRINTFLIFMLVLFASAASEKLWSQSVTEYGSTLSGWFNQQRLFSLDRSNNFGGFYYDRGLFRLHTPDMSPEYAIDLFTYRFTPNDDQKWYSADNGFRTTAGSLNTLLFAVHSEFKHRLQIKNGDFFSIEAHQQKDLRANRGLFVLEYRKTLGTGHALEFSHTLSNHKTDLDATFRYVYENVTNGHLAAEVTFMDWANNLVSGLSESRRSEYETRHNYRRKPVFYSLYLRSPEAGRFRGELYIGLQKPFEAEVTVRAFPDQNYLLEEQFNMRGALAEVRFPGGVAGIIYQHTIVKMSRKPSSGSLYELDYGNRQEVIRGGVYASYRWNSFGLKQWLWLVRNSDDQYDNNPTAYAAQDPNVRNLNRYPFTFDELRTLNKTHIYYRPQGKSFGIFAEYNGDWREPAFDDRSETIAAIRYRSYYRTHINSRNERLTAGLHLFFSPTAQLTLGASIDLDQDRNNGFDIPRENFSPSKFDGGFGRLMILW